MSPRPPDPATRSDRRREALEALRRLRALPRTRTKEETEAWIREVRLMREESTLHMLEKIERARKPPIAPPPGEDDARCSGVPPIATNPTSPNPDSPEPESADPISANPPRSEPRPGGRPPDQPDRRREALEALRRLRDLPRTRTKEETEAWIREVRLRREESTRRMLEEFERTGRKPVPPDSRDSD